MTDRRLHDDEVAVNDALVRRLLHEQFPQWADLPLRRVESVGTSHAVYRLGDERAIRLPRIIGADAQVAREMAWLPVLSPYLSVEVPKPLGRGRPGSGFPFDWLVSAWVPGIDGHGAVDSGAIGDEVAFAADVAGFVRSLWGVDVAGGPRPGKRGLDLAVHDQTVRAGVEVLAEAGQIDGDAALEVWTRALAVESWTGPPVWVHGDLLASNLVVRDGRLAGVIDWSATGVGDPACDLMAAWGWSPPARARFRELLALDEATWVRGMGWVLEQTVAFIPYYAVTLPGAVVAARGRLAAVLADP